MICQSQVRGRACPSETYRPTSQYGPLDAKRKRHCVLRIAFNLFHDTAQSAAPSYLFDAGLVDVQQGSGLHVLGDKLAADSWDLLPVVEHIQSQVLLSLLLQTWGRSIEMEEEKDGEQKITMTKHLNQNKTLSTGLF